MSETHVVTGITVTATATATHPSDLTPEQRKHLGLDEETE